MTARARIGRVLLAAMLAGPLLLSIAAPAHAGATAQAAQQDDATSTADAGVVSVLQVSGLLDPILADFVSDGIKKGDAQGVRAVVLQLNSTGTVLDNDELDELATTIAESSVPVTIWVGPSGSRAQSVWVELAALVDRIGIAPGSRFGDSGPRRLDAKFPSLPGAALLIDDTISADRALELGIAPAEAPTVGEFVVALTDFGVETSIQGEGEAARTIADTVVRFERLSLVAQQLHTVASPPVAYLLFTIGLALLVFEFYTAGVGVAGVVGAAMFLLGCFGLWVLPVNLFAVALLVFALFAFSVDVQTGVPRFWTIVGAIALVVGTVTLYRDGVSMSWIPMVVGIIGITMMMVTGMPTMVRTRFSTPTIGREWMVGSAGEAVEAVDPDGIVKIDGALWKARTNRATPVAEGDRIRVASVEGLVLEVEPEEGAARDYRERRSSGSTEDVD